VKDYQNIPLNKTIDSETFTKRNRDYYEDLLSRFGGSIPDWFGLMENRVFANFHKTKQEAVSAAARFVEFASSYNFDITEDGYKLLQAGKCALLGYDRKLRPIIYIDLFEVSKDQAKYVAQCVLLLCAIAYSKMMIPGLNDGIVVLVDLCHHFLLNFGSVLS